MTSISSVIYWQDKCSDAVNRAIEKEKEIKRLKKQIKMMQDLENKTRVTLSESQDLVSRYSQQFHSMMQEQKTLQENLAQSQGKAHNLELQIQTLEAHLHKIDNPCAFCGAGVVTTCRMECPASHTFCNSFLA